jgi:hypothetical protein
VRPVDWPWAIVLCRFSDRPAVPQPPEYYEDLYTRNGTGGVADYWREVTFGRLDLTGSRVFGWLTMNHATSEVGQLVFPGQRGTLVQWGRDAAAAAGIDLTPVPLGPGRAELRRRPRRGRQRRRDRPQ